LLLEALQRDEFPWDYSYFKWQDIPVEVRRQMVLDASQFGRACAGRSSALPVRPLYAWHSCRETHRAEFEASNAA
jgi:hypothetical protein